MIAAAVTSGLTRLGVALRTQSIGSPLCGRYRDNGPLDPAPCVVAVRLGPAAVLVLLSCAGCSYARKVEGRSGECFRTIFIKVAITSASESDPLRTATTSVALTHFYLHNRHPNRGSP